jgi:hypothetical protein
MKRGKKSSMKFNWHNLKPACGATAMSLPCGFSPAAGYPRAITATGLVGLAGLDNQPNERIERSGRSQQLKD